MKKHLQNILAWFQTMATTIVNYLTKNLPFRKAVGRLGLWLTEVDKGLQISYAEWNLDIRLEHEFHPNPNWCTLHVTEKVTEEAILTYNSIKSQPDEMTPMAREIFGVKGVALIMLKPYEVAIEKAKLYKWKEILPRIEAIILKHQTAKIAQAA